MSRSRSLLLLPLLAALALTPPVFAQQAPAATAKPATPPTATAQASATQAAPKTTQSPERAVLPTAKPQAHRLVIHGVTLPRVIHHVDAAFPDGVKGDELEVRVRVAMVVSADGKPTELRVVKPADEDAFNQSALRAVSEYRFQPALRKHVAIAYPFQVTVEFRSEWVDDPAKK